MDKSLNTGSAVILVAGGGHNTLNVGTEAADFVPFFYNYGVNTVILRNRLRKDGYNAKTDAVYDAQQAIRLVRAHAKGWRIDPNRIGIMGFSAVPNWRPRRPLRSTILTRRTTTRAIRWLVSHRGRTSSGSSIPVQRRSPAGPRLPSRAIRRRRLSFAPVRDQGHAIWATEYFMAMLKVSVPNIEMHIYGNGHHPGSGSTGGLTDRKNTPYGTWQYRFIDWFRDLGFLQNPGVETAPLWIQPPTPRRLPERECREIEKVERDKWWRSLRCGVADIQKGGSFDRTAPRR